MRTSVKIGEEAVLFLDFHLLSTDRVHGLDYFVRMCREGEGFSLSGKGLSFLFSFLALASLFVSPKRSPLATTRLNSTLLKRLSTREAAAGERLQRRPQRDVMLSEQTPPHLPQLLEACTDGIPMCFSDGGKKN
ncbi:hypothetical protein HPB51_022863 [Rhipicephalus microplus]|uniref:Uncharacterized protein n=1 Tax=Rhipicephalus microplus TaxID=6941 RepID=A0A9J6DQK3_RHIMP|nr:hypothetical protein HPB51_022863 [Rhipicephalus microplus]